MMGFILKSWRMVALGIDLPNVQDLVLTVARVNDSVTGDVHSKQTANNGLDTPFLLTRDCCLRAERRRGKLTAPQGKTLRNTLAISA
jgi:hypothetical protein